MKRFLRVVAVLALLLLFCVSVAWAWGSYKNHKKVRDLKTQMAALAPEEQGWGPPSEDRRDLFRQARDLPDGYRQEFFYEMRTEREAREKDRLRNFFAMSKEEQNKELDKQIAAEEKRNKDREASRKRREAERAASGQNGNGSGNNGSNSNNNGNNQNGNGSNGQGGPGGGPGGGFGRGGSLAQQLDRGDPELRSMMGQQRVMSAQRRIEQGLPPSTRPVRNRL